jgi:hypothetical protein
VTRGRAQRRGGHVRCHYGRQTIGAWELQKVAESAWVRGRGHGCSECACLGGEGS